ncbi:MAG TPA: glycosyl transferase family 90 [Gammaproteobacteria bacterium]|nr:glycosyl transferase family 90 [Gammaproteobacteria bacterium]
MKKSIYLIIIAAVCALGFWGLAPQTKLSLFSSVAKYWARIRVSKPSSFVDEKVLKQKIAAGLPAWAREQITADLSKFSNITHRELDEYFVSEKDIHNQLMRVKITNGQLETIVQDPSIRALKSYKIIQNMLEFLAEKHYVPDIDFILCLQDFLVVSRKTPVPVFTFAKDITVPVEKDLILVPDWMNLRSVSELKPRIEYANFLFPWNKKQPYLFWRGSLADSSGFRRTLVSLTKKYPTLINAQFSQNNPAEYVSEDQHVQYRYQITIDGSRATWERLVWQLRTNCLVFKHRSNHVQWFYKGIMPNAHYFSVQNEDSLLQSIAWSEQHPKETQDIIAHAMRFAAENLTIEDMYHYWIGVLTAYSKQISGLNNK